MGTPTSTFAIDKQIVQTLSIDLKETKKLLFKALNQNSELASMLDGRNEFFGDTNGEVHLVTVDKHSIKLFPNGKGSFQADFDISYYFGCSDQNTSREESMSMDFEIDIANSEIKIIGENLPEREPDNY